MLRKQESERFGFVSLLDLVVVAFPGAELLLRQQLARLGHPVVGDGRFAPAGQATPSGGLYLWCTAVLWEELEDGRVSASVPAKFERLLDKEQKFRSYKEAERCIVGNGIVGTSDGKSRVGHQTTGNEACSDHG
eukprot:gnl/TRDRNA2_/TRDRNA2_157895_c0_seq1.p2 gnl/TRDRNA2_/TRDRNA2_157895_c0~~gnl/TRDRNA2_/TRDRNA2_157895_c0_seq1.p2  ORF type:complete len:134 (+),score=31.75 gnl/TRDRNA2_/TRDRNA2_157895_c0_seq1:176-577(+)